MEGSAAVGKAFDAISTLARAHLLLSRAVGLLASFCLPSMYCEIDGRRFRDTLEGNLRRGSGRQSCAYARCSSQSRLPRTVIDLGAEWMRRMVQCRRVQYCSRPEGCASASASAGGRAAARSMAANQRCESIKADAFFSVPATHSVSEAQRERKSRDADSRSPKSRRLPRAMKEFSASFPRANVESGAPLARRARARAIASPFPTTDQLTPTASLAPLLPVPPVTLRPSSNPPLVSRRSELGLPDEPFD